ncbi:hypothetical protein D6D10_07471 [Aureobasidium pullulans]|uniref:S-adenosyl-L-methionine-dependent methyltransferase n=1 Tax=Aureobasidium pullulans TaxID=5580 RepID=A0A4V4J764_AURPU|nr:hypothetical protein D6D10_07471 [Aureobasidium pullulans]
MPEIPNRAQTEDSTNFSPDAYFEAWEKGDITAPYDNDFRKFILSTFGLPHDDTYTYAAVAEVSLLQAQTYVEFGGQGGLHAWYRDDEGKPRPPPPAVDIAAYTNIFKSTTATQKALVGLASNAKKDSIRASVGQHLQALYQPPSPDRKIVISKLKKEHTNPYFDVWAWSCQNLEWAGPEDATSKVRFSHAILPILYHHFGCVCPSYESLSIIYQLAKGRTVLDLGSGNGYWSYMLRVFNKQKPLTVVPVDNGISEWRTVWVGDTIQTDGVDYLQKNADGKDQVLLLVYPQVGLEFTSKILKAYKGDTIICAGTQNSNGYTAFAKETIADWIAREMPVFEKVCQIPLPSFAAKDEALFAFQRKAS